MKKFFTFAAAVLASMSLLAVNPTLETMEWGADDFSTVIANHDGVILSTDATEWGGNFSGTQYIALGSSCDITSPQKYFAVSATNNIDSIQVYWAPNGTDASNLAWVAWTDATNLLAQDVHYYGTTDEFTGSKSIAGATWQTIDLSNYEVKAIMIARQIKNAKLDGSKLSNFGKNKTVNILGIRVWAGAAAVITDPVTEITIAGPTEAFVGQKVTLKATTDVKADTIWWTDQYGTVQDSKKGVFEFTPDAEGTYTYTAWAQNQYNVSPVSLGHSVVVSVRPVLEQVIVTDHTTWDFTKAATVSQIKWEGDQKDATPIVMANIDGFNNDANFNSQALLFSGEYPIRDSKYCQGPHLEFEINAPGLLTVVYSNTGNRSAAEGETEGQEALRRFLTINGELVAGDAGSMKSSTNTTTGGIAVAPGAVVISACMPYGENPTAPQYLRIYKVVYQRTGWPTAIVNNEAAVKAVKVIRDGKLFIEKNGVVYNAQGAIVK